jgi:hypothetical protein
MSTTYTEAERRQALVVYASQNGRAETVKPLLAEAGLGHIPIRTLQSWAYRDRRDEYEQIKQEWSAYVRSQAADTYHSIAALASDVSLEALRQTADALARGEVALKDLPKVAREAMLAAGIATDKGELLSGNPTSIVKTGIDDVRRDLASVGVTIVMPGAELPAIDVQTERAPALPAGAESG